MKLSVLKNIFVFLLILTVKCNADIADFVISTNGTDNESCKSRPQTNPCKTFQYLFDENFSNANVNVTTGEYDFNDSLEIKGSENVTIFGDKDGVIISSQNKSVALFDVSSVKVYVFIIICVVHIFYFTY